MIEITPLAPSRGSSEHRSLLACLAIMHGLVDGICVAGILWSASRFGADPTVAFGQVTLYNLLAFASQAFLGLVVDEFQTPRGSLLSGVFFTGMAWLAFPAHPYAGLVTAGIGNALFHLGAGTLCLGMGKGRAAPMGLFVAPGVFGVWWGTLLSRTGDYPGVAPLVCLAILTLLFLKKDLPTVSYGTEGGPAPAGTAIIAVLLLSAAIVIRSFVGQHFDFPWKTDPALLLFLTLGMALGKAGGGFLADRMGWSVLCLCAMSGAALFFMFGADHPGAGIAGMALFNLVMPVTLTAVACFLPGRPGFAFGLTCLALNLGLMPLPGNLAGWEKLPAFYTGLSLLAAIMIWGGLGLGFPSGTTGPADAGLPKSCPG